MTYNHNDEPAENDLDYFGTQWSEKIFREIIHSTPPKNIGINGYWGTGKTSFLLQLKKRLDDDPAILTVWFEAWRCQHDSLPIVALLNEIRSCMSKWDKLKETVKGAGLLAYRGAFTALSDVSKAAGAGFLAPYIENTPGAIASLEHSQYRYDLPSTEIRTLMEEAIKQVVGESGRIVIFIDDLDRCQPRIAHRLLEGIKIYLTLNNCIVVLGMDRRQIAEALGHELKLSNEDERRGKDRANEYLEKICQDIISLPVPDPNHRLSFFCECLKNVELGPHGKAIVLFNDSLKNVAFLPANPRKIKILVNRLAFMLRGFPNPNTEDIDGEKFYFLSLIVTCFYCYHPGVYEQLESDPTYLAQIQLYIPDIKVAPKTAASSSSNEAKNIDNNSSLNQGVAEGLSGLPQQVIGKSNNKKISTTADNDKDDSENNKEDGDEKEKPKQSWNSIPDSDPLKKEGLIPPVDKHTGNKGYTNPSDSNVFRSYWLFQEYEKRFGSRITNDEAMYVMGKCRPTPSDGDQ